MTALASHKVVAQLPDVLEANAIYYVRIGNGFDVYIVNGFGNIAHTLNIITPEIVALIEQIARREASYATHALQESLAANSDGPAKSVLAVGFTNTGKVQGCSLGNSNIVKVFASGADYINNVLLHQEFMQQGEPICFTGLSNGAIITSSEGFYGVSENVDGISESPMPLLSYGLSFKKSFVYSYRNSENLSGNADKGFVFIVNGAVDSVVSFTATDGSEVDQQSELALAPWQWGYFETDGNEEYHIDATYPVMACTVGALSNIDGITGNNGFYDCRLVMPLTTDGILWPCEGHVSAPYPDTTVKWWCRDGVSGTLNDGWGISPGYPVACDAAVPTGTGATEQNYEPDGATRFKAKGLITAYSGDDSDGLEATPMMPVAQMSQVVAQPFFIHDTGDGGNSGIAIASLYVGSAKIYEWNDTTQTIDLAYTISLTRNGVWATTPEDQNFPAAGALANGSWVDYPVRLTGDLKPGVVIADVPIMVVAQNGTPEHTPALRSQNHTQTTSIISDDDETLLLGCTPKQLQAEITQGSNGLLYKRIVNWGSSYYEVA